MTPARAVSVRPRAVADLAATALRIGRMISPATAIRWRHRMETAIRALADDADQWPEADEAVELGLDLRCRLAGRRPHIYRILFTISGQTVHVLRVRHAAQDYLTEDDL